MKHAQNVVNDRILGIYEQHADDSTWTSMKIGWLTGLRRNGSQWRNSLEGNPMSCQIQYKVYISTYCTSHDGSKAFISRSSSFASSNQYFAKDTLMLYSDESFWHMVQW